MSSHSKTSGMLSIRYNAKSPLKSTNAIRTYSSVGSRPKHDPDARKNLDRCRYSDSLALYDESQSLEISRILLVEPAMLQKLFPIDNSTSDKQAAKFDGIVLCTR
ncbi:unnamed protein product [Albugo candida]|uniref:Uncharacterized protein n=1 Tax=Albugo candida TaxID=65357 RepID=A0A024G442_9STRA|nr:unnamed protein product [Albugo candida]|eukprot:CCI41084.1 unnamed protein product [Albugo candida]